MEGQCDSRLWDENITHIAFTLFNKNSSSRHLLLSSVLAVAAQSLVSIFFEVHRASGALCIFASPRALDAITYLRGQRPQSKEPRTTYSLSAPSSKMRAIAPGAPTPTRRGRADTWSFGKVRTRAFFLLSLCVDLEDPDRDPEPMSPVPGRNPEMPPGPQVSIDLR